MMFYSDHSVVVCKLNCLKPPPSKVLVNYRTNSSLHSDKSSDRERLGLVAKSEKRRLERMFRNSHLTVHRQLFMLDSVKSDYFKAKIDQVGNHRLFKTIIDCSPQDHRFSNHLWFSGFLVWKFQWLLYVPRIRNLRSELQGISKDHAIPVANDSVRCSHLFSKFDSLLCLKGYFMLKISHHKLIFAYMEFICTFSCRRTRSSQQKN